MTHHGKAALLLDHLWTDPDGRELLAALTHALAGHPAADQHRAAATTIRDRLRDYAGTTDHTYREVDPLDVPGWLRLSIADTMARYLDGTARTCLHNPDPRRPTPAAAVVWRPGVVTCGAHECSPLLNFPPGSAKDRTCDGCGHICEPTGDDMVRTGTIAAGALIIAFGVCRDCNWTATR